MYFLFVNGLIVVYVERAFPCREIGSEDGDIDLETQVEMDPESEYEVGTYWTYLYLCKSLYIENRVASIIYVLNFVIDKQSFSFDSFLRYFRFLFCFLRFFSLLQVREKITALKMQVVGWYHSHPTFKPIPSNRDVDNQHNYQV